MDDDFTAARMISVLPQVNALPGAQHQLSLLYGDAQLGRRQCRLDMGGHIIGPLQCVRVEGVAFRYQPVEPVLQIDARTVIVILLDQQARRGMLDEQGAQPLVGFTARYGLTHRFGDAVQALPGHGY